MLIEQINLFKVKPRHYLYNVKSKKNIFCLVIRIYALKKSVNKIIKKN